MYSYIKLHYQPTYGSALPSHTMLAAGLATPYTVDQEIFAVKIFSPVA